MLTRRLLMGSVLAGLLLSPLSTLVPAAKAAEPGTLTVAQSFDPVSLWPNWSTTQEQINVGNAIVESLFWMDPKTNKLEPVLAKAYTVVDPTHVRLDLRTGITFTNGEPMNAAAVVASIKVFADPTLTPAYTAFSGSIGTAQAVDDHTVMITMKRPDPALDVILSQIYITPPAYWAEVGVDGFGQKPVGTGPFVLDSWTRDDRIVLATNPAYWGEAPKGISRIVWRPVPDDQARAAGLSTGEYDIATNISIASASQIESADRSIVEVPSYRVFMLALSGHATPDTPLRNKLVRQAVNYAIDKEGIIEALFEGKARALSGQVLRAEQPGFDPEIKDYPYDADKAKALLAEAGFPDGFDITFKFPSGRYVQDREVATAIAGMLGEVGIRAEMVPLEAGEFLRQLNTRELAPMSYIGLAPNNDPGAQISQYRSDWRYSYVDSPELDKLVDAGAQEMDPEKRAAIYREAGRLMHEEASVAFLFQSIDLYGVSSRVSGFLPRGDQRWVTTGVSLTE